MTREMNFKLVSWLGNAFFSPCKEHPLFFHKMRGKKKQTTSKTKRRKNTNDVECLLE